MSYLLDTNICVYSIKKVYPSLDLKLAKADSTQVFISIISVLELEYGIHKSAYPIKNKNLIDTFLAPFDTLNLNQDVPSLFGKIRTELERKGTPIGLFDMLIAAHSLSLDFTLVTNNEREFSRVQGLKLENWTK